jgi:hypothetical protein
MKRLLTLALAACASLASAKASSLLNGHEEYFRDAKRDKGLVSAKPSDEFEALGGAAREAEIKKLMLDLQDSLSALDGPLLFKLEEGAGGGLWALPEGARAPQKIEAWDRTKELVTPGSKAGRWFAYVGLGAYLSMPYGMDSMQMGLNLGVKVGSFLLNNLFDVGVSLNGSGSLGLNESSVDSGLGSNVGLFGRVHFPIYGALGGNVGAEASLSNDSSSSVSAASSGGGSDSSSTTTETALLAGLSLFIPNGSIDFDARFVSGSSALYNIGLTTFLGGPSAPRDVAVPRAKPSRSPSPAPSRRASLSPSPTPQASPDFSPTPKAATAPPTQAPTPTWTPSPQPTAVPTLAPTAVPTAVPTAEATPDKKAAEAAAKLEAERKALDEEKAKLADERKKLEEEKAAAAAAPAQASASSPGKRGGFSLGGGIWDPKMRSRYGGSDGEPADLGLELFWNGWSLGVTALNYEGEAPNSSGSGGGGGGSSANNPSSHYTVSIMSLALGYDWTFLGSAGEPGFQMYLPLRLHGDKISQDGALPFSTSAFGASLGLGLRYRFTGWLGLEASGRYHAHLAGGEPDGQDTSNAGGGSGGSGSGGSSGSGNSFDKASLEGPEFKLAADFYLW